VRVKQVINHIWDATAILALVELDISDLMKRIEEGAPEGELAVSIRADIVEAESLLRRAEAILWRVKADYDRLVKEYLEGVEAEGV